jgi:hypothetical protein
LQGHYLRNMAIHLLGIRHHGPGSARHLLEALQAIKPSILLVEGPPEGEAVLQWIGREDMKPPVALLAYVPDNPQKAVFYPFAEFSPEWQAIRYALAHKIPVRFIDMPLVHKLAEDKAEIAMSETPISAEEALTEDDETSENELHDFPEFEIRRNPISYLAEIAGYEDEEEWWEHHFETGRHSVEVFEAVKEAMVALREQFPGPDNLTEQRREAFMRRAIKLAERELYADIAVVCGAWHVPALLTNPKQKDDDALLKGLPKTKVEATWIPWTADRLSFESGYGAGVNSPGWYKHCWNHPDDDGTLWLTHVARIFRKNKIDTSSAHIIEAVRLANALAALRALPRAGLKELNEATQTVMCMGDFIPMQLVWRELIVGNSLGEIPEGTPQIPLQRDLDQQIRQLRLKLTNEDRPLSLDLREESGLQKSILLHRLLVLDVKWGRTQYVRGKGTFKEEWILRWEPEMTIHLLEKAPWGNTVEMACNQYLAHLAAETTRLDAITQLAQSAIPAELHVGIQAVMQRMDALAATTSDTTTLMAAFVPLVQLRKYGNVRGTDGETIAVILESIFYRMIVSLPISCTGIDEDQAAVMAEKLREVHQAVNLLDDPELREAWIETLDKTMGIALVAPLVQGTCCKMLYDVHELDAEATAEAFSRALSVGNDPGFSAAWLEGFLKDAGTVLILDDAIWQITNEWVAGLQPEVFQEVVPLLRRTFAVFQTAEKRKIAEKVKHGQVGARANAQFAGFNAERAAKVLPILAQLMGL